MYLNCHTWFSFKYGTLRPEILFQEAKNAGIKKLVLTEINNTASWIEFGRICKENQEDYQLEFVPGIEFRNEANELLYIGIAKNNNGFEELCRYLSYHNNKSVPLATFAPPFQEAYIIYPLYKKEVTALKENEYIGIKPEEINKLIVSPLKQRQDKLVVLQPVTFAGKVDFNIHKLLRAIDKNTLLSKLSPQDLANPAECILPLEVLKERYRDYPQLIENAEKILASCSFKIEFKKTKNKEIFTHSFTEDIQLLRDMAFKGLHWRYSNITDELTARFEKELRVIGEMRFAAYFLITWDMIAYAKKKGYAYVGRGSGANSLIAYCLDITDVDPIELDLYFERFLNPERTSPPDFDIDFSWKDRDDIIHYIFNKYGYEHTLLLATHTTFQKRSMIRELGKVFGLPKAEIDSIVQYPAENRARDKIAISIFQYSEKMKDFPKNFSIHAGGIIISEEPVYRYTATSLPPKDFPVTHYEMHMAEDIGYYKFDVLSQRGLGHIKDAVEIIKKNRGVDVDIKQFKVFKEDPRIRTMLREGKAIGCFYVESPAMRMLLVKMKCQTYLELVAASSIIRPGVASSGMMGQYIFRHHNPDKFEYIHPIMKELMAESYGVMIYQEDVIKVAHYFAKLTLGEADILRRGMSGKYRSRQEFKRIEHKFFENCKEIGYPDAISKEVWRQMESFAGYSFSKAHSASFAVESYQSLYLKAYYPLEFMVGVINNFGGFYRTEIYFHEARMQGAIIEAPCVNNSEYLTSIRGKQIYTGFIHLKNLNKEIAIAIPAEREINGKFTSLDDFIRRIPLALEQAIILVRIGALRFTGKSKKELLWEVYGYFGKTRLKQYTKEIFYTPAKEFKLPALTKKPFEDAFDEIELLEFALCHPFNLLASAYRGNVTAATLSVKKGKTVEIAGYLVTTKDTTTVNRQFMHFGTFLDENGEFFDSIHFPPVAKKYPFRGKGFYMLKGKVTEEFGFPMIEVFFMEKLPMVNKDTTLNPLPAEVVS